MIRMILPLAAGVALLATGCAREAMNPAAAADHPANPVGATAPLPEMSWGAGSQREMGKHAATTQRTAPETRTTTRPGETAHYTCPMHPEIVSDQAGRCPKCGMDLVRKTKEMR